MNKADMLRLLNKQKEAIQGLKNDRARLREVVELALEIIAEQDRSYKEVRKILLESYPRLAPPKMPEPPTEIIEQVLAETE